MATVNSAVVSGTRAEVVRVEADARRRGLRQFKVVGLAENAVREGRVRVETALANCGFRAGAGRITVNLAPADLKKSGTAFDLPIALAVLAAQDQAIAGLEDGLADKLVVGELALDGRVESVRGCLPYALLARRLGFEGVVLPWANAVEAQVVQGVEVLGVTDLADAVAVLTGARTPIPIPPSQMPADPATVDLSEVRGQPVARRALEVTAAGGHNLLMVGPPGAGKTMLARRLPTILPAMSIDEQLEVTVAHSLKGFVHGLVRERPFRAPHHSVSMAALVGGGVGVPSPGEVSLAHHGVLFLDELPEFSRPVLESLREPLEAGEVVISRAQASVTMSAMFTLVAAMNPCPCGREGVPGQRCQCSAHRISNYQSRISGPLLDRIDLQIRLKPVSWEALSKAGRGEGSRQVRERVSAARKRQQARGCLNVRLGAAGVRQHCPLDDSGRSLLQAAVSRWGLSARSYVRVLKVARTLADLAGSDGLTSDHVAEALQLRCGDGVGFGPTAA